MAKNLITKVILPLAFFFGFGNSVFGQNVECKEQLVKLGDIEKHKGEYSLIGTNYGTSSYIRFVLDKPRHYRKEPKFYRVYPTKECAEKYGSKIEEEDRILYVDINKRVKEREIKERLADILDELQKSLNEKEIMILQTRLLSDEPRTLQDIADIFGISRERVRQIEVNLLKKMKKYLEQEVPDIKNFFGQEEQEKV